VVACQALAGANQEEVNSMWAGLGYYRRARYLLEGAQYVMEHHGGVFPKTSKELQKIPGAPIQHKSCPSSGVASSFNTCHVTVV
jgi:A/G-specific adenine glycosylase